MTEVIRLEPKKVWDTMVRQLKMTTEGQTFSALINSASFISYEDGTFIIGVTSPFSRTWLEERLTGTFVRLLTRLMDSPQNVSFVLGDGQTSEQPEAVINEPPAEIPCGKIIKPVYNNNLLPRYSFDTFVVGPSNNFAAAAAKSVADSPCSSFNPLFMYSGVGLGKTHLLHAIGNRIREVHPELDVLYVTSEEFTSDFINSIRHNESDGFREKYRQIDVLLIDDIQFIIGKESTQEAFFHTFNALYQMNKQIVISSDRQPKMLSTLDERMRSRFECGLQVDIQPPDLETRMAILADKANRKKVVLPQDVLEMLARLFPGNIRQMEGALTRVTAVAQICNSSINHDFTLTALSDMLINRDEVGPDEVIEAVCKEFNVSKEKLLGRDRSRNVALARHTAMYLIHEDCDVSLPQVGQMIGGRDHSTVVHGCNRISGLMETDVRFRRRVSVLRSQIFGD